MTEPPKLVFATRNRGKLVELRDLMAALPIRVVGVFELDRPVPEVEEDGDTFAANATKKAREVARASGLPALADDSGLEVDALAGAPGVRSARFAGPEAGDAANNAKLLEELTGVPPARRTARFRCVVALADSTGPLGNRVILAHGTCEGTVLEAARGTGGFGYDPLFFAPELGATFAEAGVGAKSGVSHRARAVATILPELAAYFRLENVRSTR